MTNNHTLIISAIRKFVREKVKMVTGKVASKIVLREIFDTDCLSNSWRIASNNLFQISLEEFRQICSPKERGTRSIGR